MILDHIVHVSSNFKKPEEAHKCEKILFEFIIKHVINLNTFFGTILHDQVHKNLKNYKLIIDQKIVQSNFCKLCFRAKFIY